MCERALTPVEETSESEYEPEYVPQCRPNKSFNSKQILIVVVLSLVCGGAYIYPYFGKLTEPKGGTNRSSLGESVSRDPVIKPYEYMFNGEITNRKLDYFN